MDQVDKVSVTGTSLRIGRLCVSEKVKVVPRYDYVPRPYHISVKILKMNTVTGEMKDWCIKGYLSFTSLSCRGSRGRRFIISFSADS